MPYASNKQAAFMHIHHPEITAKWHEEGHGYVKGGKNDPNRKKRRRVKKSRSVASGWLKPVAVGVGTGTVGGALANQFPSYEQRQRSKAAKAKKKGLAKRLDAPTWPDDEFFNAEAAQQAYDLVMKMDRDTAEMFVTCVVSEALENDIENNRRTLQKHLDEVIEKQITDLKRATMRVVSKGGDAEEQLAFAQALAVLEEITKVKTPYDYGYIFRETDIRRDPGTGQFQTKIKHTQKQPINDKTAGSMGIAPHPAQRAQGKAKFTNEQKAQYQDEYRQLANFLGAVHQSSPTPGDNRIDLHFEDKDGNQWIERTDTTRPDPKRLDPRDRTLRGITAYPAGLTVGGAAFGLAGAMGGGMTPQRVAQVNAGAAGMPDFAANWTKDYGTADTNARLYGRTGAAGQLLTQIAPEGSKANLAGHFGNFVGQYGPQAEAVIGPPARKTAYRYRGTEKKPDAGMVREYEIAVRRAMSNREKPGGEAPTLEEQQAGAAEIAQYLQRPVEQGGAAPRKGLYNLQLASGNTPPSEGVILDRDGQIVTQAIGYGDDHYLPFNLKNLKGLKGGSYIRNRSVGGLTSEDIYTGLVSGARSVTVVSRSGTFTMEFEPDFRGGRRHNDKAARMTRRYEQILDAVQSEQVERQGIDPQVRQMIIRDVRREADEGGFGWDSKAIREQVNRRIEDYKSSPEMDDRTMNLIDATVAYQTQGMTETEANRVRARLLNQVAADKEYKFRLNGAGYADALESLREQFPYYIKTRSVPTKEEERHEIERDLGYVEPGKNRPTAAAAGLFGIQTAEQRGRYAGVGGKVSAATADYAHPFKQTSATPPRAAEESTAETPARTEAEEKKPEAPAPSPAAMTSYADKAVPLQQAFQQHMELDPRDPDSQWMKLGPEEFRAALNNKDTQKRFDAFVERHGEPQANTHIEMQPLLSGYQQASGLIGGKAYEPVLGQQWNPKPFVFHDDKGNVPRAYQAEASDAERFAELKRVGGQQMGTVNLKPLDQMSNDELRQEVVAVGNIRRKLAGLEGEPDWETKKSVFSNIDSTSPSLQKVFGGGEQSMDAYLEQVHRVRALNHAVPAEQRGFKEVFHPAKTERNEAAPVEQRVDELAYFADKALDQYDPDTKEHDQLSQLKLDLEMQRDRLTTPRMLEGVQESNRDAITLIMRGLHEGKIPNYRPAEKPKGQLKALPPSEGGPIIS